MSVFNTLHPVAVAKALATGVHRDADLKASEETLALATVRMLEGPEAPEDAPRPVPGLGAAVDRTA